MRHASGLVDEEGGGAAGPPPSLALRAQLFAALDSGFDRVVLEMSVCELVVSTGLGVLVAGLKQACGRRVVTASASPESRRDIEIVGLDRGLPHVGSRTEVLRRPQPA